MLRTPLTDLLGSTVPIVGAPMAGTAGPDLARAITAGGGTGMVGLRPGDEPEAVRAALAAAGPGCGAGVLAWSVADDDPGLLDAAAAAGPVLAAVSYGDWQGPAERLRAAGVPVCTVAGNVESARAAVDAGVDVLVVRGGEGGGHGRDEVATLPLLQQVLDEVDHPCVVAAGGIASARGLAAVLAAGAAGAWMGTAFLASPEAANTESARTAVLGAATTDTAYSRVYDVVSGVGWPREFGGRALRNHWIEQWAGHEDDLDAATLEAIRGEQRAGTTPVVYAGESAGLVTRSRSATEIVAEIGAGAEALLRRWSS